MIFDYPYTDMHELNLDWFLAKFKDLVETWNNVESEWNSLHDYVQNYFENLNVQTEIDNKINAMILNGTFADIVSPFVTAALPALVAGQLPDVVAAQISSVVAAQISAVVADQLPAVAAAAAAQEVGTWLAAHIDPDTGYVIDDSLTVSQAAADAKTVGDNLTAIRRSINEDISSTDIWEQGSIISDGSETSNTTRIRTKGMFDSNMFSGASASGDYSFAVIKYDYIGQYVGIYLTDGTFGTSSAVKFVTAFDFSAYPDSNFRLVLRKTSDPTSDITPSVGVNVNVHELKFNIYSDDHIINTTWADNMAVKWNDGTLHSSSIMKVSDFIYLSGNDFSLNLLTAVFTSSSTFGLAFYDKYKNYITGYELTVGDSFGSIIRHYDTPSNASYFRTIWYMDEATYGTWYGTRVKNPNNHYYIAAADSVNADKWKADYICDGVSDVGTISLALRRAIFSGMGKLVFAEGTYHINEFPFEDFTGINIAFPLGLVNITRYQTVLDIVGEGYGSIRKLNTGNELIHGVHFVIDQNVYNNLDANKQYAIFGTATNQDGSRLYPGTKVKFSNMSFVMPDNQKKIICIDGYWMTALSFDNIQMMAVSGDAVTPGGAINPEDLHIPVEGTIGIRGLQGSCYGINNIWSNSFAWGFDIGFQVVGEHIVGMSLGARYCNHAFVFGSLNNTWASSLVHPNTLINCCDEFNFNLPIFGHHDAKQNISLIDYNLEWRANYAALGGDLATELTPGETYGEMRFTSTSVPYTNVVNIKYWETGHGYNVKTVNGAHAFRGSTLLRNSYTPQLCQTYYDTDLNKLLIYDGVNWRDMNNNIV